METENMPATFMSEFKCEVWDALDAGNILRYLLVRRKYDDKIVYVQSELFQELMIKVITQGQCPDPVVIQNDIPAMCYQIGGCKFLNLIEGATGKSFFVKIEAADSILRNLNVMFDEKDLLD